MSGRPCTDIIMEAVIDNPEGDLAVAELGILLTVLLEVGAAVVYRDADGVIHVKLVACGDVDRQALYTLAREINEKLETVRVEVV